MSKEEIQAIVDERIRADREAQRYATLEDVPKSYCPSVKKLMDAGFLAGYNGGKDGDITTIADNTILVDETFCRIVTVLDRAGALKV